MNQIFRWIFLFFVSIPAFTQPTDNPYKSRYGGVGHWTDSLNWAGVRNVTSFGAIANDNLDDSAAVQSGINQIHQEGGGVLFFPAGTYNISGHIKLKTGVVLRGENPTGITKATTAGYAPPSKLVFPKYVYDTSANGGTGTSRNSAFKSITGEYSCSNSGIVNLDINRAYIGFHPEFNLNPPLPFQSPQMIQYNRNIIVLGCRSNNAVILDGGIPTLGTPAGSSQRPWQVFPWRFTANIDVYVAKNSVIANNRLNDGPFDDFDMPNYRINQRNTSIWFPLGPRNNGGWKAQFDYNAHYGIALNRAKIYKDTTGRTRVGGVVTYGTPDTEPDLFRTGLEIRDNWVYKTSRVGITAAGIGLLIKGNVTRDQEGKDTPAKENFTGPQGFRTPQGATTLENRGIDFSGWQVTVDSNDVEAIRNYVAGYLSTDGEGILLQECCGGTQVNDYVISNNIMKNYIGVYKMRDINNLKILNNNMGGQLIFIVANTNGEAYFLNNFLVEGNSQVGSIDATGTRGGFAGYIRNNAGTGTAKASMSCHVKFENNNTGFSSVIYRAVDPDNLLNHTPPIVSGPCAESTTYPQVVLIRPIADTTFENNLTQYSLKAKLTQGDIFTAKIDFLQGTQVVAENLVVDPSDSTASYVWNVPANATNITSFTARVRDQNIIALSEVRKFTRVVPVLATDGSMEAGKLQLFPNPMSGAGQLFLRRENQEFLPDLKMYDLSGKAIQNQWKEESPGIQVFETNGLKPGFYFLRISTPRGMQTLRWLKY